MVPAPETSLNISQDNWPSPDNINAKNNTPFSQTFTNQYYIVPKVLQDLLYPRFTGKKGRN